jgi:hypothetical protein
MAADSNIFFSRDSRRGDTRYRANFISSRRVEVTNLTTGRSRIISRDVFKRRYF